MTIGQLSFYYAVTLVFGQIFPFNIKIYKFIFFIHLSITKYKYNLFKSTSFSISKHNFLIKRMVDYYKGFYLER